MDALLLPRSYCSHCSRTVDDHLRYGWNCIGVNRTAVMFAKTEAELKPMDLPVTRILQEDLP